MVVNDMHDRGHSTRACYKCNGSATSPNVSCGARDRKSLLCRYYYQVGDGTTFSTTYNFTTFVDVSKGAWLSVVPLCTLCITVLSALPEAAGSDVCMNCSVWWM